MKISKNFLTQYVDIDCSLEQLCDKLTCAGIEVEEVESTEVVPKGIVVAKILERNPHPNADALSVCKVFDGTNEIQIVCGAPNCDAGKLVPLATVGTVFKDGDGEFVIKKAKLRGVESFGMMCSGKELGLSDDHSGLMELDADAVPGTPLNDLLGADSCITVEVTPNRADWLSHYGIARDVACLLDTQAKLPEITVPEVKEVPERYKNLVTVMDNELCPRYTARVIENVKVAPSPKWLQDKLIAIGLRPINNIVDISNYVLMELGQPLHVFDLDKLAEKRVVIRRANDGEKLELLDGKVVELAERHLVIADAEKPVVLAGIMGGEESGVTEQTVNCLIESAVFFSSNIRSSSRELGVSSDSSYRYERGVDFDMAELASRRCAQLILELAGGELVTPLIDVSVPRPAEKVIPCRYERINKLLGLSLSGNDISGIFRKLQLKVSDETAEGCVVTAPLFRLDLTNEADLAEEVARIHGLAGIPLISVTAKSVAPLRKDAYLKYQQLREDLIGLGLFECYHYSTVSDKTALSDRRFKIEDVIILDNPLSLDLRCLRPSLFGEMLNTLERNIARRNLNLRLFEQGRVFCANPKMFPEERMEICVMMTGSRHPELFSAELAQDIDFYDLKGTLEALFNKRRIANYRFEAAEDARFVDGVCAKVVINGKCAGFLGEIAHDLTKGFKTTKKMYAAVLEVEAVLNGTQGKLLYKPFSMYPATSRDVAFVCDRTLEYATVIDFIRKLKLAHLEKVELFDIFTDDKIGADKKSMAFKLTFRHAERTLTDDEINKAYYTLRDSLANKFNVELR